LSAGCGLQSDGCGGTVNCGSCDAGETCNGGGQCVEGTNWWDIYDQPDATNTGPNCSAAGCPSATLSTGNAPPDTITQSICNSQPGCTWSNFIKNGRVVIEAKGVTFYNFQISSGSSTQGVQIKDTDSSSSTDLTMEYGEIVGGSGCGENVHGMGWTARYMEIHNCDDNAKVHTDGTNGHGPVLVEYSWLYNAWGGHGDNFQNVTHNANDPITVRRNSIEGGGTAVLFLDNIHTVTLENNRIYWGDDTDCGSPVYCGVSAVGGGNGDIFIRENLWDRMYETHGGCFDVRCTYGNNRWSDDYSLFSP
jgi:hypothetical protein